MTEPGIDISGRAADVAVAVGEVLVSTPSLKPRFLAAVALILLACTAFAAPTEPVTPEMPFLKENQAAMDKMMAGMDVGPSGDVDADFAAMMIPHHQGAIDMAVAELRYGHNEQLRRVAQEIVVEQQQEIVAMRLALRQPLPPPSAVTPDRPVPPPKTAMPKMNMQNGQ